MTDRSAPQDACQARVAYLTSQYPAVSHTFIRREVAALRKQGAVVETFSVRPASAADVAGDQDRKEAARTFTLLSQSAVRFLRAHLWGLSHSPARYGSTLALALRHRPPGLRALLLSLAHFAESILLAQELHRRSIEHLHNHFANSAATVGMLASHFLQCRWSFVVHGPSETDYPAGYLLGAKVRAADMVICASWFGSSQAMRLVPREHWRKFHVVRCGVPFAALPPPDEQARDEKLIICVGRLTPDKGQAGLIESFAKVRERYPDVVLKLVGGGPDRDSLEEFAAQLGVGDAVIFSGPLPEAETLRAIGGAGMLVLPSFWEGLPVVLMEAMALGVPVVTSRIAGVPELVSDGSNGLLFTPAAWDELTECMTRLLSSPDLRRQLAAAGRARVAEEFDVDISAAKLMSHFGRRSANVVGDTERPASSPVTGTRQTLPGA